MEKDCTLLTQWNYFVLPTNPFENGKSFQNKSFQKRIQTPTSPKPKIFRGASDMLKYGGANSVKNLHLHTLKLQFLVELCSQRKINPKFVNSCPLMNPKYEQCIKDVHIINNFNRVQRNLLILLIGWRLSSNWVKFTLKDGYQMSCPWIQSDRMVIIRKVIVRIVQQVINSRPKLYNEIHSICQHHRFKISHDNQW